MLSRCLVLALLLTLPAEGAKKCRNLVSRDGGQLSDQAEKENGLLARSYSEVARSRGLRFLMFHVNLQDLSALVGSAKKEGDKMQMVLRKDRYYNNALIPIFSRHTGKWANYLIGGGSDSIGMGVRYKGTFDWHIGFLLPIELLDEIPFFLQDGRTVQDRSRAINGMPNGYPIEPGKTPVAEFAAALDDISEDLFPDSKDAMSHFSVRFLNKVPVSRTSILWFPAPLFKWALQFPETFVELGKSEPRFDWYYHLPNPIPPTHMKISEQVGDGWKDIFPRGFRDDEVFDPLRRVGTWYTAVPDWDALTPNSPAIAGPPLSALPAPENK